jgi:hypothetical protein
MEATEQAERPAVEVKERQLWKCIVRPESWKLLGSATPIEWHRQSCNDKQCHGCEWD